TWDILGSGEWTAKAEKTRCSVARRLELRQGVGAGSAVATGGSAHHGDKILGQPLEHFPGHMGRYDLAHLAGLLFIAAERHVAAPADHELVIAGAIVPLLWRGGAKLHRGPVPIDLDNANRLKQIGEPRDEGLA